MALLMQSRFGGNFIAKLQQADIAYVRILDLNQVVLALEAIMRRHRTLAGRANVTGPFYLKAHIENVWRAIPFVDHSKYWEHILNYGFPIVQESDIIVPSGLSLQDFVLAPELKERPSETTPSLDNGSIRLSMAVLNALGIPFEVLTQSIGEIATMGDRSNSAWNKSNEA